MTRLDDETVDFGNGRGGGDAPARPDIRLHIERLVIDEVVLGAAGDARQLGAAVEAELTRLLGEGGLSADLAAGGAVGALPEGTMDAQRSGPGSRSTATSLGDRIANAVFGRIGE